MTTKEKNVKRANLLIKLILIVAVLVALALIGLVLYDIIGLGYGAEQIEQQLSDICSKTYVWLTGVSSTVIAVISYATVKIAQVMDNSAQYVEKVKALNIKLDATQTAFTDTVSALNNAYSKKQDVFEEREVLMGEQINILLESVYDPEVKEKILALQEQINALQEKEDSANEEIKETTETESTGE